MSKKYYFFFLEIALRNEDDPNVYAFQNVSHIPTAKLVEIFNMDLKQDPYFLEGYFLEEKSYLKHEAYIKQNIGEINLELFEYCLRQYVADDYNAIRKLYKEDPLE